MRSTSAAEDTILQGTTRHVDVIVRVQNASGTWIDYTDASGYNWLDSAGWGANVDQPVPDAEVRFHKFIEDGDNLAPLDETSPLNVDDGASYAAALDSGRQIDIQAATVAIDGTPSAGDYKTLFHGEIDSVEWGREQAVVRARDRLMAHLADRWIESKTEYGTEAGRAVEDVIQDVLDDWTDGRVNLWVPTAPGFVVTPYEQQVVSVLDAITQLAQLTGWDLRSRWNASNGRFELQFFEPDRSPGSTDWDFSTSDIFDVQRLDIDREPIRNVVRVSYTDQGGERKSVEVSDSSSIDRFGRRWMEISEASDSPIDTNGEATTLANAALNDLSTPDADQQTEQDFFWPIEVGDYMGFEADERWYSTAQELGVYGFRHELSMDRHLTRISVRGKPAGQYLKWRAWESSEGVADGTTILDLREIERTTSTVTYAWTLGADVANVWILRKDAAQPVSSDPWPSAEDDLLDVLGRNTTQYTFDLPDPGTAAYIHLEPTDSAGRSGPVRRLIVLPLSDDPDRITALAVRINDSDGSAEVRVGAPDTCQSYRYAYNTGSNPSWPTDAAVESGTVRTISTVDSFVLAASTVGDKEWITFRAAGYTNNDGTGPDGTATDHGPIVDARDKRITPIGTTDIEDGAVTVDKVTRQAQRFSTAVDFSATDFDTVEWTNDTITFGDGTEYTVDAGNTGNMSSDVTHWIYFDPDTSTTELQVTTTRGDITAENRILMCTAWPASNSGGGAGFVPAVGILGVTDVNIAANSVSTNTLQANSVTATKINVVSLSAITADLGTVTAGTVDTNVLIAANSFTASNVTMDGKVVIEAGENATLFDFTVNAGADAKLILGQGGNCSVEVLSTNVLTLSSSGSIEFSASQALFTDDIVAANLPTADPANAGQFWNDSGTVKVSAG